MKKMLFMLAVCLCMIPADVYAADLGRQTLGTNDGWEPLPAGQPAARKPLHRMYTPYQTDSDSFPH